MKRTLPLVVALSFFAQTTGAADFAAAFGAARPGHLAFPHPQLQAPPNRRAAPASAIKGPSFTARAAAALSAYSDDVFSVVSWTLDRALELDAQIEIPQARQEAALESVTQAVVETAAQAVSAVDAATAAVFEKPVDRILIVRDDQIIGVANALGSRFGLGMAVHDMRPSHKRVEGIWLTGKGFRYRVNYLDAYGTTMGEMNGFRIDSPYSRDSFIPIKEVMPKELRRLAPIYFHGMKARYEIEIVADEPLRGVKAFARQEELDGRKLTDIEQLGVVNLAPGQSVTFTSAAHLRGAGQARVNFETTHVVISGADGSVLADDAQAGLVDPPGDE